MLKLLREKLVVHRDFVLSNLLISEDLTLKLCNFGNAVKLTKSSEMLTEVVEDKSIQAPEM